MTNGSSYTKADLIAQLDSDHAEQGRAQRQMLATIVDADKAGVWIADGARNMASWVATRYGVSHYRAEKWVSCAHKLGSLPRIAEALATGQLSLDKTVELTRIATPRDEARLLKWARRVTTKGIRDKAQASEHDPRDVRARERERSLTSYRALDDSLILEARLPAYEGSLVLKAIDRIADELPLSPEDDPTQVIEVRRADALVALAAARVAVDQDPEQANVVVHVPVGALLGKGAGCLTDDGVVIPPEVAQRLACGSRLERYDMDGLKIVGHGEAARSPNPKLRRALGLRDDHRCTFPQCQARKHLVAHHIRWWTRDKGPTDLDNLVLVCPVHHKLVHEFGWDIEMHPDGVRWFKPDGSLFRAGPAPPDGIPPPPERIDPAILHRLFDEAFPRKEPSLAVLHDIFKGNFKEAIVAHCN